MRRRFVILILVMLAVACEKVVQPTGKAIAFDVMMADALTTRAEITGDNIPSNGVYLYGKKEAEDVFAGKILTREVIGDGVVTGRWLPEGGGTWDDEANYTFWAYSSNAGNGSITVSESGKQVSVTQPTSYSPDGFADYLLSYQVAVAPTTNHSLVPIQLEHSMTKVELYVFRGSAMTADAGVSIEIDDISFDNIYNSSLMQCPELKNVKDSGNNVWSSEHGSSTVSYSLSVSDASIPERTDDAEPVMSFIAIPLELADMTDYTLSITYTVTVTKGSETIVNSYGPIAYRLKDYGFGWKSSHLVRYAFHIDSAIHLTGSILDWVEVDYIEGTLLPPVEVENQ